MALARVNDRCASPSALEKQLEESRAYGKRHTAEQDDLRHLLERMQVLDSERIAALEADKTRLRETLGLAAAFIEEDTCRHDHERAPLLELVIASLAATEEKP